MKNFTIAFLFLTSSLFAFNTVLAQACGGNTNSGAVCGTRSNFYFGEIVPNAGCGVWRVTNNYSPGEYFRMPVLQGGCYSISTCGSSIDTQIGAFQGTQTNNPYAHNDDNGPICGGTQASVLITPNFSDYTRVDVRQYNCQPGGSASITVRVRQNNNLVITSSNAALCVGQSVALTATPTRVVTSIPPNAGNRGSFTGPGVSQSGNNFTFTAPAIAGASQVFTITYSFGYCSTTQNITVYNNPSVADAEQDSTVCGDSTVLDGNTPTIGTGLWTTTGGATITNPAMPNSPVTNLDVGENTFIWTITNGPCSTSFDTVVVTTDTVGPTVICQNINVPLDASGNATIIPADIDNGSSDSCGIDTMYIDVSSFSCSDMGSNSVKLVVVDVNGNADSCTATVTVVDNIAPNAVCQNVTVNLDASGSASITTADVNNGSTDNCGIASMSLSQTTFTCADVGSNTVTLSVVDGSGNTGTCSSTITVVDNMAPTAICQNTTVNLDASGNATITTADINNGSTDNCAVVAMSLSQTAFTCSDIGSNSVTLTVTDAAGNSNTCSSTVTVVDNMAPNAVCQNATITLDASGNATIAPATINNGSTDNCGIVSMSLSQTTFTCADAGSNTVTLSVTDAAGNTGTCTATVTVVDNLAPNAVCQNATVNLDASGNATITPAMINNGSTDNCSITSMSLSQTAFTCAEIGPNMVTLTVTDAAGNSNTCTATITVVDNMAPNAVCQSIDVYLDANGNATIDSSDVDFGSTDNCGIATMSLSTTNFTCADLGANSVTMTVTDNFGNSSTCTSTVTVLDSIPPVAVCQNLTVYLDMNGAASIQASDIDNGSTDNCSISSMSLSNNLFSCSDVGPNTVVLTVFDADGNSDTCSAMVTVLDTVAPVAKCQPATIYLDSNGIAVLSPSDIDFGSLDACGVTLSIDMDTFTCADMMAPNLVILTAIDPSGNTDTCHAMVTVMDTLAPVVSCQDFTAYLDASGNVSIIASDLDNGSTDNCGIDSMSIDTSSFTCSDVGMHLITLTAVDASGNSASCTSTVTVMDSLAPMVVCQNIDVYFDSNGLASITTADIDGGTTDNCGLDSVYLDRYDFTCDMFGVQQVILSAVDIYGNLGFCMAEVTLIDTFNLLDLGADTAHLCNNLGPLPYTMDAGTWNSYLWSDGSTGQTVTVDPDTMATGNYVYSVTVTSDGGCVESDSIVLAVDGCSGVAEIEKGVIALYPNPASDFVNVSLSDFNVSGEAELRIWTMTGQIVLQKSVLMDNGSYQGRLDVSELATGVYFVEVQTENASEIKRFVIK